MDGWMDGGGASPSTFPENTIGFLSSHLPVWRNVPSNLYYINIEHNTLILLYLFKYQSWCKCLVNIRETSVKCERTRITSLAPPSHKSKGKDTYKDNLKYFVFESDERILNLTFQYSFIFSIYWNCKKNLSEYRQNTDRRQTEDRQKTDRIHTENRQKTYRRQTEDRQKTDKRKTEDRQKTNRRQKEDIQKTDRRQTEDRQKTDGRQTEDRQKTDRRQTEDRQKTDRW